MGDSESEDPAFDDRGEPDIAKQTLIVVIDIKSKTEIVLENPSSSAITAVYIDEFTLMLGSHYMIYYLDPKELFFSES